MKSYPAFIGRSLLLIGLLVAVMVTISLVWSAASPGNAISAFTTTAYETSDVWIMDVSRMQFVHIQVKGHKSDIPVWSPQERQLTYFPRMP